MKKGMESVFSLMGQVPYDSFGKSHYICAKDKHKNKFMKEGDKRENIRPGLRVKIVLKEDQKSGKLTEGIVKDLLTNSSIHPHGIKVRLESGEVGRVKEIVK
ncbi:YwbE family protein [Marinifilum sp.]|uniref:YwbE family protein n=1 Tax=Marinifilum sp. TaxID=2033137 RepID=UPI003BAA1614